VKLLTTVYNKLRQKVQYLYQKFKLFKCEKTKGRKLSISIIETISLALYRHASSRLTKKSLWNDFKNKLKCSYKTLVVNMNRFMPLALIILQKILCLNRSNSHLIKHTDSTDIPVCLNKNAGRNKTMNGLAEWGHSGKGFYYGLKLHLTSDLERRILSISFTPGNKGDRAQFMKLNKDIEGIFIADAGYISKSLEEEFAIENKRILFAKPRKNMFKLATFIQNRLYDTRMTIELNFRNLKMFYGLITSLPRSIDGYFSGYIYSILSYVLK
jgi:hypothetical protein